MNIDSEVGTLKSILASQLSNADQYGDRERIETWGRTS